MTIRVYYEDTDLGGVVYHANYLKFCERDRSEKFFNYGVTPHLEGGEFVAVSLEADFKAPASLGDLLEVQTDILSMNRSVLQLHQRVYKEDTLLFDMTIKLGFIKAGRLARMSDTSQAKVREIFA